MLEEIRGLPDHVVGLRATGNITKEHYDQIFVPAVDRVSKKYKEKANLLLLVETDLADFSGGAYIKDILTGYEHISKWNRIALITDEKWVDKAAELFEVIVPGEYMGFEIAELETAKQWVEA